MAPGCTTTTWMPNGASSMRSESLSPSTANFVAWYQAPIGSPNRPPIEDTLTMRPPPLRAHVRKHQLGQPGEREDVDLQLAPGLVHRHLLERRRTTRSPALFTSTSSGPLGSTPVDECHEVARRR